MSTLDIIIAILLALGLLRGFATGFVRQVAHLLALILSFIVAARFTRPVAAWLIGITGLADRLAPIVAFIIIFIVIEIITFMLARLVERALGALHLSILNRVAGGLTGVFKTALVLSIILLLLSYVGIPGQSTRRSSVLYEPVRSILSASWDYAARHLPDIKRLFERFAPPDTTR